VLNVVVPKSQDTSAPLLQELIPRLIAAVGMLSSIGFDNEFCLDARKIGGVRRDWVLSTEALSALVVSQLSP